MLSPRSCVALLSLAALMVAGCTSIAHEAQKSPLARAQMSPDSSVLEIFFVRVPFGDSAANDSLWADLDEQHFPPATRQKLSQNGFRVGLVSGQIPVPLAELMQLSEMAPPAAEAHAASVEALASTPQVLCRHIQARAGRRNEIVASGFYDELPVLVCESGQPCGRTYPKAQGIRAVSAWPEPDGRVRLELTPELHYGETHQRWVGSEGALRMEAGRPRRVFDDLVVSATLVPGHMLVLTSLPSRAGSVGHSFFTGAESGQLQQKLLLIRVAQTQHDDLFAPTQPLPLEQIDGIHTKKSS